MFILLVSIIWVEASYSQELSGWETKIYHEILKLERQLARQNPDLMDSGDTYYTQQMEDNVHNEIANKYGITINQSWDIMERGLYRKLTEQEQALLDKIAEEFYYSEDEDFSEESDIKLMQEVAEKYGLTFDMLYELQRREFQQWEE